MFDPVTIAVTIGTVLFGMTLAWPYISDFLSMIVKPLLERCLGKTVSGALGTLLTFIERPANVARGVMLAAWRKFKQHVLGIKTRWTLERDSALEKTSTYLLTEDGTGEVEVRETTRRVPREKLPPDVRAKMIQQGTNTAEMEMTDALEAKVKDVAKREKILLTAAV